MADVLQKLSDQTDKVDSEIETHEAKVQSEHQHIAVLKEEIETKLKKIGEF